MRTAAGERCRDTLTRVPAAIRFSTALGVLISIFSDISRRSPLPARDRLRNLVVEVAE